MRKSQWIHLQFPLQPRKLPLLRRNRRTLSPAMKAQMGTLAMEIFLPPAKKKGALLQPSRCWMRRITPVTELRLIPPERAAKGRLSR